jgi:hypothetical protein
MYINAALLDVTSMHPTSTEELNLLGPYTKNYSDLKKARIAIKHEDYVSLETLLDGKLMPFVEEIKQGLYTFDDLANALKTPINSAYGLTSAKFDNPFRDPRNIDNIVAKRGALFMIDLKFAVEEQGFKVAHIKTDSIKIPEANQYIIKFITDFGKKYGYDFEHEATYEKMCLVNDAVYIAKYASKETCESLYGYAPKANKKHPGEWTATGAQFAHPFVFKSLFSKAPIEFKDLCETKSVTTSLYLDMNEKLGEGEHDYHFVGKVGSFCPIKPGRGGAVLLREKDGKYYAATGSKGYRWLEAEMVQVLEKCDDIDRSYFGALVDDAIGNISKYGDSEWFINSEKTDVPPWMMPCGLYENCMECPNWIEHKGRGNTCSLGHDCIPF